MKPLRSSYPPNHLCNPAFRYVSAAATDIRETIRRARLREQRQQYVADVEHHARLPELVRVD